MMTAIAGAYGVMRSHGSNQACDFAIIISALVDHGGRMYYDTSLPIPMQNSNLLDEQ